MVRHRRRSTCGLHNSVPDFPIEIKIFRVRSESSELAAKLLPVGRIAPAYAVVDGFKLACHIHYMKTSVHVAPTKLPARHKTFESSGDLVGIATWLA